MTNTEIAKLIRDVNDFPKKGIVFKDIAPILASPKAMRTITKWFVEQAKDADVIVAPDARGFLFGPQVAAELNIPFVMIRKPNKLPGEVDQIDYSLEYGTETLQVQKGFFKKEAKVIVIDDLLATGGTVEAIIDLVAQQGAIVIKSVFLIELEGLYNNDRNIEYRSMIKEKP